LKELSSDAIKVEATAGLAVMTLLPESTSDVDIALRACHSASRRSPLLPWYMRCPHQGLLLGMTNVDERRLAADCRRLVELAQ
jgi:GntR family transcriptional regulator/MocR family aminotransferase